MRYPNDGEVDEELDAPTERMTVPSRAEEDELEPTIVLGRE
ncbi:hypothetical protein [Actinokineospora sp. HUAS TT18]